MSKDVPLGIKIPYSRGNQGFFDQTFSDIERCHTNLKMLLMTQGRTSYDANLWK